MSATPTPSGRDPDRSVSSPGGLRLASALRESFAAGYGARELRADAMAGVVVGIIAVPLSMALAIATGVPPQYGLYTAIVAGVVIALLGGSRLQVSGPTAAFVVILAPIVAKFGLGGLLVATLMAGGFLVLFGLLRMGRLIQYIPYTVTIGFTAGIAVVLATLQVKDFMGLTTGPLSDHSLERTLALVQALPSTNLPELLIGLWTLGVLVLWPRLSQRFPPALIALGTAALLAALMQGLWPEIDVATINSRFSYVVDGVIHQGIPRLPPLPDWPWAFGGADGQPLELSIDLFRQLAPAAFAIAMLGAIESLLSAVIADGMAGTTHDPDSELIGQGVGNIIAPFFGGFAATGALARTAANVRSGGRTPVAAVIHALFVFGAIVLLAPMLGYLPMSALAALLLVVAWNMAEARHIVHILQIAPRSDVVVLVTCFTLTVLFDMVIAVSAGVVLASLLFMKRMAEISGARLVGARERGSARQLPRGVLLYEVQGPLFFGAAQKAMSQLQRTQSGVTAVIVDMQLVPAIDATGLLNLESAIDRLRHHRADVYLVDVQPQPAHALEYAGLIGGEASEITVCADVGEALAHIARRTPTAPRGATAEAALATQAAMTAPETPGTR